MMRANTAGAVFSSLANEADSSMLYSPSRESDFYNGYYVSREPPRKRRKKRTAPSQAKRDASKAARAMRRKQKMR